MFSEKQECPGACASYQRVDVVSGTVAQSFLCVQASRSGIGLNKGQSSYGLAALEHRGP